MARAKTFETVVEVRNFLLANPGNRVRDKDGDIVRAYSDERCTHYLLETGEELRDMNSRNYGPWVEIVEEEPRFQEPGPEDLHWNDKANGLQILTSPVETKVDPEPYRKAQGEFMENYERISFEKMDEMLLWLITHPGREVEDKNQLRIYFGPDSYGDYTFRYGAGASITVQVKNGPWKVVPEKESIVRKYVDELIKILQISSHNKSEIMDFLKKVLANH